MKRIYYLLIIQIFLLVAALDVARAGERREFYNGIRCLAMGGACIAAANDETALLINPSGLGRLRDFYGTIIDPEVEVSSNFNKFNQASPITQPFTLDEIKDALDANRGTYYHTKAQVFPSFVGRNFGFGIYGNYLLDAEMNSAGTEINTYYRNDLAFVLGYNFRLFDGRIKIGFNARLIDRIEVDDETLDATASTAYPDIATGGLGLGTDASIMISAPWTYLPTITAVLRDIGGTSFDKGSSTRMSTDEHPNTVKQDLDVGMALFPIHSNSVRSAWTIEYRGLLTSADEDDKAKLIHAGLEMNFGDVFFVRAGYNQRYFTGGLELASEHFQWQLATYGEEVGTNANHKEDRRYALKMAVRF
jgi:hypothetical protein